MINSTPTSEMLLTFILIIFIGSSKSILFHILVFWSKVVTTEVNLIVKYTHYV